MTELRGDRLTLRPITPSDAPWLLVHWNEPSVRRHLFDDALVPVELVAEIVGDSRDDFASHGYGLWAIVVGHEIGVCGLRTTDDHAAELLYSVDPRWQGKGLALEAARLVVRFAFEDRGAPEVVAETDAANTASQRLAEKLGMIRTRTRRGEHGPVHVYTLRAPAVSGA
ncbi:GNAT family N-acetyltransferase [Herbidospora sp. NEAU-GS84]|uniref:GNAT family N-acetyltransferase n=1 Tax=Herbidospora solisilvae TaxID=2696284 RepID=A0A7C9JZV9_9ACTN|nr:GNAT family N-acetyltransferase [Herbidospora solisilvae]NAS26059.1 GNAT family N-acetyltransferase [Herbidospora solisilvae]